MTKELKTDLPYGRPVPVGDQQLWNDCMHNALTGEFDPGTAHPDVMTMYANVRGISRPAAKHETFIFRYGSLS